MSSLKVAEGDFDQLYKHLLTLPAPLLPPGKSSDPSLTDKISSLYVHPTIEAALHILNNDLPSAHFLVRHMQTDPQFEAMFLHGILHRIEGDYNNTRAWYDNVKDTEVFKSVWSSEDDALKFVDEIEAFNKQGKGDKARLEQQSLREIRGVIDFSVQKYGTGKWQDASTEWCQPQDEESRNMRQNMVSKGEGRRNF